MLNALKRNFAAAAMALTASVAAFAQTPEPAAPPPTTAGKVATPASWTITKPNGKTITLFGSVHLLPLGLEWKTDAYKAAFEGADVVVLEMPITDAQSPEVMQHLQQNLMNPPGVTLSTLLNAEEKAVVEKAAGMVGATFAQIEPLRPWFASLQISVAFIVSKGYDPNAGVDKIVEADARAAGKTFDYFETALQQVGFFTSLTPDQEKALLVEGSKQMVETPDELVKMIDMWAAGDADGVGKVLNEGFADAPDLAKILLIDRNIAWADKIAGTYMNDDKNYLIVVGSGHYAGNDSVQELLAKKGIIATRN